ncbi:serine hydrolase [Nonomuraea sp. NPDC049421]|uniref:serine hydrolase n=1 Tax=Nonomuraea sp. NPDC049421 TaxID=3155275 RepID=UPI003422A40A
MSTRECSPRRTPSRTPSRCCEPLRSPPGPAPRWPTTTPTTPWRPKWFLNGSFGVVSTADDLAKWLIAQNGAGPALPGNIRRTVQTASGVGGSTYGMGWYTGKTAGGAPRLQHTGWLLTHNVAQTLLPASQYGIAVVTNTGIISGDDALLITDGLVTSSRAAPTPEQRPSP